ncbi:macro domain-containing protein [Thermomonospora amylolytica]|uniref:macro domain-containing protein n=1 Tax=Thermomonospora amylolytica TaxID=1411117 RepID=UPI000E6CD973|nr:macro domain-containing protein [Thermomonospora amylolytica]
MTPLRIVRGDATDPQAAGPKIIAHVCNDRGGWGKGFVLAISRRWPEPERDYRRWHRERSRNDFGLGAVRLVQVRRDVWVANMIGQHGMRTGSKGPPIRYDAVERCLTAVAEHAARLGASVHMPRIGCGLAGGRWERIEPIVIRTLCARDIPVTVYDVD